MARSPLSWVIALFPLAIVLSGWAAVVHQVRHERSEAEAAAIQVVQNRAMALEQYVTRTFKAAELVTRYLGQRLITEENPPRDPLGPPVRLDDPIIDPDLFADAHVIAPNGDLVATTLNLERSANVANHPIFRVMADSKTKRVQFSQPLPAAMRSERRIHAYRRIRNGALLPKGFVDVEIRPDLLINFLKDARFQPTDLISVIGLNGVTFARREGSRISSGEDLRGKLVMKMQFAHPNGSYVGPSSIDGLVRYFSHRRLPGYPIFVTAGISRDAVMAPVERRARVYYAVMSALTLATIAIVFLTFLFLLARQRRLAALAEANRRLRQAQQIAKIGRWDYVVGTGKILWSDQLCAMYERDPAHDVLTLDDFRTYLNEADKKELEEAIERAIRTGETQSYEFVARLPSGATSDRHVIAVPVRDDTGKVQSIYGTDQDVTDDKLLHALQGQIAHLGRVDAMNMMASTLAHELNQPLTAASNYLSGGVRLLASPDPEQKNAAAEAMKSAKRQVHLAAQIIKQVRGMMGREPAAPEPTSLWQAAQDAASLMITTGACERDVLAIEVARDEELVLADPIQLQQVLLNLMRNACKAAEEREHPRVTVRSKPGTENSIIVEVADNGRGITCPVEAIFSPFGSERSEGLGLGLSISRTIVEYHGGRIWVAETGPTGTVVAFSLTSTPLR